MNQTLYNLIGYLLLPIMLLRLFFKGLTTPAYGKRIGERLGFVSSIPEGVIWVHCVSVGEFRAATVLIDALIKQYPQYQILITSTTPTGSQSIQDTYQKKVLHYYFPFDLPLIVNRYVKKINPKICILLETEIWPSLFYTLHKNKIPSLLVNARLSPRSLERYQKFAPKLAKKTLNKLNVIATQSQNSAQRFIKLGANKDKVMMAGNIKFELNPTVNKAISKQLNDLVGKRKVVVFASTHKGEEVQIIEAYAKQKNKIDALLIIIPRHPERFNEVYKLAQKNKINIINRSDNQVCTHCDILLGDSMGEMMNYFDVANVVFMGGSLVKTGGHNMLEPAALAKPILFGTHVFNFAEISTDLLNQNAAIQVQNADELFVKIALLLTHEETAQSLGNNAQQYLQSKQGATSKLMQKITSYHFQK
ncbi:3-deoxy-D-manno-octulosonic acid transferase (EC (EC [Bathymodiolus thermophilus thioautotrophic gill symbiont]|uniref:lipid IV(A) 3-deoxy-D-manno-octulosonic acid transferase n=1 Tax=Bathymodiolus thermophilus thioautotrophic gill symbiont TaxID=2360 RepID=UPI00192BA9B9|nr:lipid IV(A) 3-deoxy-D-manno-octulosonic acid transferase [Bathymodiolus thermophilus thioautotrophic gill symbiont]CAB5497339.1 3-deoxy-D-manno-octulosonic acid transferase (EC (EC [Bathymodiolus thermophilus thioautotrophic gill symbiont]